MLENHGERWRPGRDSNPCSVVLCMSVQVSVRAKSTTYKTAAFAERHRATQHLTNHRTNRQLDWVDLVPAERIQPGAVVVSSYGHGPHRITSIEGPCTCPSHLDHLGDGESPSEPHYHLTGTDLQAGSTSYLNGYRLDGTSVWGPDLIVSVGQLPHVDADGPDLLYWGWTDYEWGIAAERFKAWTGRTAKSSKPARLQAWWRAHFSYRPIDIYCFIDPDFSFMDRVRLTALRLA
jgi:hypothetical protein